VAIVVSVNKTRRKEISMMNRSNITSIALFMVTDAGCVSSQKSIGESSGDLYKLRQIASDVLGLDVGTVVQEGVQENMVGVRSKDVLVSRRKDSRTFFVEDIRYQSTERERIIQEPDQVLLDTSYKIVSALGIPREEISRASVLTEKLQTGRYDPTTKTYVRGEITFGKRFVEMGRSVEGIPVFSSRALIGLMRDRRVGSLEVHWPEIPQAVFVQARRYRDVVKEGWKPPDHKDAIVEAIDVGIIHSPALGFAMDMYPVIRIIYASKDGQMGRKPVLYLDVEGHPIPAPRTFEKPGEPPLMKKRTVDKDLAR
jgi:hypothetical protein